MRSVSYCRHIIPGHHHRATTVHRPGRPAHHSPPPEIPAPSPSIRSLVHHQLHQLSTTEPICSQHQLYQCINASTNLGYFSASASVLASHWYPLDLYQHLVPPLHHFGTRCISTDLVVPTDISVQLRYSDTNKTIVNYVPYIVIQCISKSYNCTYIVIQCISESYNCTYIVKCYFGSRSKQKLLFPIICHSLLCLKLVTNKHKCYLYHSSLLSY